MISQYKIRYILNEQIITANGIVYAENFTAAFAKILDHYCTSEDAVIGVLIEFLSDENIVSLDEIDIQDN